MPVFQSANHGVFIDHFATGCVDDDATPLHRPDLLLAHEVSRIGTQRDMQAEDVRLLEELVHALDVLAPLGRVRDLAPGVVDDAHGEGTDEMGETEADPAEAEDAERASREVVRLARGYRRFPRPFPEGTLAPGKVAETGNNEEERGGRGGIVDGAGGVGHSDACLYIVSTYGASDIWGERKRRRTSSSAFLDVDLIVACAVVCDPSDGASRSEGTNELLVEHADPGRRFVVAVYAYCTVVFPTWPQPCKEISPVGGVHSLPRGSE